MLGLPGGQLRALGALADGDGARPDDEERAAFLAVRVDDVAVLAVRVRLRREQHVELRSSRSPEQGAGPQELDPLALHLLLQTSQDAVVALDLDDRELAVRLADDRSQTRRPLLHADVSEEAELLG